VRATEGANAIIVSSTNPNWMHPFDAKGYQLTAGLVRSVTGGMIGERTVAHQDAVQCLLVQSLVNISGVMELTRSRRGLSV
jgi:hypothetical protein